jgi:ABC-type phosphate/phosphonate transport system substrate-binding protein
MTPSLTITPTLLSPISTSISSTPTVTTLPEGTVVVNWYYAISPPNPESKAHGDSWARGLSDISGLNVVSLPGPTTDMEILEGLRDGKIQMAELNALAYVYGQAQGWIEPGPVLKYTYQPDGRLMFVARNDTGLLSDESEQMYQQLAGKRPCWPNLDSMNWLPIYEYIAPSGLLAQKGIELGQPVFISHPKLEGNVEEEAVFLKKCDFAVLEPMPVEGFMSLWFPDLKGKGYTFNDWTNDMQVLYYTPPLVPYHIMAFSSQLNAAKRELLADALLVVPMYSSEFHWIPYDAQQSAFYDQFQALVDASEVDVANFLSRVWDQYLQDLINADLTPSPIPAAPSP